VTGPGVPDDDMPNFSWLGRRDASAIEDVALAALLSGTEVPGDLPAGLQPAADVVAALRARPASDELAGETVALAEFRARVGVSDPAGQRHRRRPSLLTSLASAKAVAAAAVVALTLGGVATAAYAGALPSSAQRIAHDLIGAPDGHKTATMTSATRPAHPRPHHFKAPAACVAFFRAELHGTPAQKAAAFQKLEKAAGGADKIAAYCGFARRHPGHHFHFRPGCQPFPHPSWSAYPQPSWSPSPTPTATASASPSPTPTPTASCPPPIHPVGPPFPHRHRPLPIGHHAPHRPGKPSRPAGNQATKSGA
jgi:hypothetical protein